MIKLISNSLNCLNGLTKSSNSITGDFAPSTVTTKEPFLGLSGFIKMEYPFEMNAFSTIEALLLNKPLQINEYKIKTIKSNQKYIFFLYSFA